MSVRADTPAPRAGDGEMKPSTGYTVLARRYRSRDFAELVGQEPIARTLQGAIASGRVAHAYLFCGTRGVGKTSMARIFAKALNVTPDLAQGEQIADAILRGDDLDVIEIDGASNRGVQEARDLIAGAGLAPARCPHRIYIIDEVHMLTKDAFNTLLKTMEEPPPHVKFILCTTEPNKVPATIQSRCQRFDFRAISTDAIARHLRHVLRDEGIEADDAVVRRVAAMGNGSMRDALSLLERLLASGERRIDARAAEEMLGLPDHALVRELVDAILAPDAAAALRTTQALVERGATPELVLELLVEHLRHVMIAVACPDDALLDDLGEDARAEVRRQSASLDLATVVHMIAVCDAVARGARQSAAARALLDAAVVRLCCTHEVAQAAALLAGEGEKKKPARGAERDALSAPPARPAPLPPARDPAPAPTRTSPAPTPSPARPAPAARPSAPPSRPTIEATPTPAPRDRAPDAAPVAPPADLAELWTRVGAAAHASPRDGARLEGLEPSAFDGRTLALSATGPHASFARAEAPRIAEFVSRVAGVPVKVEIVVRADEAAPARPMSAAASGAAIEQARRLPAVAKAIEIFDAEILAVDDSGAGGPDVR